MWTLRGSWGGYWRRPLLTIMYRDGSMIQRRFNDDWGFSVGADIFFGLKAFGPNDEIQFCPVVYPRLISWQPTEQTEARKQHLIKTFLLLQTQLSQSENLSSENQQRLSNGMGHCQCPRDELPTQPNPPDKDRRYPRESTLPISNTLIKCSSVLYSTWCGD